jgi:hypothetical protein
LADKLAYTNFLFWETLAELETEEIESVLLGAGASGTGRTAKVMVADIAFCDERALRRLQAAISGTPLPAPPARSQADKDARVLEVAKRPWFDVEEAAKEARQRLVDFTRNLTRQQLVLEFTEGNKTLTILQQLQERVDVVRSQRSKVQAYCGSLERWGRAGMRKLMEEQHANFMDAMSGLTEATMLTTQVCDVWTIRDVYAHVLGWNQFNSRLLRHWPEPNPEIISEWQWREGDTMASFNERMMTARAEMPMEAIADALATEHRRILRVFDRKSDAELCSEGLTWGGPGILSNFFYEIFVHEAEHAAQIWAFRAGLLEEEAALNRSDDS